MLTPEELNEEQFSLSVLGGYKREDVDAFFASVSTDYEKLYRENTELLQKLKVCASKIEEYQKEEQYLKTAIINAEKLNENSLRDLERKEKEIETTAREKAQSIVEKAQLEAENIVKVARLEAADSIKEFEAETAVKIAELKTAQQAEEKKLASLKKEVSDFKDTVYKLYRQHINSLSKIPDYKETETVAAISEKDAEQPDTAPEIDDTQTVEQTENSVTETVTPAEPEETVESTTNEKTAEFVIEKTPQPKKNEDDFDRNFKFKGLKFGTDFDIRKQD